MTRPPLRDRDARVNAATVFDRNLVVVAGAGTGKTSLLVERFLNLVLCEAVALDNLLAITFTEKAMGEMRERVAEALEAVLAATGPAGEPDSLGDASEAGRSLAWLLHERRIPRDELHRRAGELLDRIDLAAINTIHSTCSDLLRRNALDAGLPLAWSVDEGTTQELLFDELWPEFLADELGPGARRRPLWEDALARFDESEIEEAARSLAGNPVACDLLAEAGYEGTDAREAFGEEARRLRDELAGALDTLPIQKNMSAFMETAVLLLDRFLADDSSGLRAADPGTLPRSDFWDRKDAFSAGQDAKLDGRKDAIETAALAAHKLLKKLRTVDEPAVAVLMELLRPFAREFRRRVLRDGLLVYDDLLLLARNLLKNCPQVRRREAERARAILVDEFQDTDPLQYEIVFYLAAADPLAEIENPFDAPLEPGRLFIVGDPKQSIYRFRGADMAAFMEARGRVLDGGAEESLATNFRSRPGVLRPLNLLFKRWMGPADDSERDVEPEYEEIHAHRDPAADRPDVELWTVSTMRGDKAEVRRTAEARAMARFIRDWLAPSSPPASNPEPAPSPAAAERPRELKDIAILFRSLGDLPLYARELRRAGIDFVVDGGKAFVERPEVVEALALLEALANPADPVSTLAVLRSPLGGVTDAGLAAYARAGGRFYWPGKRDAALARDHPEIDRALTWLRDLDRATRDLPIDRRIQVALTESGFLLPQAAFFEGAQRTANIRKLAERAAGLARDRGLTLEEAIRHLRGEFTGNRGEGESPLADEAVNAVRILTIHKAKGLEFPLVMVPDLGRGRPGPRAETRVTAHLHRGRRLLAASVTGRSRAKNTVSLLADQENARHDEAETKRILYVATTRAKDRLVLVNSASKRLSEWVKALGAHWGYTPAGAGATTDTPGADAEAGAIAGAETAAHATNDAGAGNSPGAAVFTDLETLAEGGVLHRTILADQPVEGERALETFPTVELARAFREAAQLAGRRAAPAFRTPSGDRRVETVDSVPDEDPEPRERGRQLARAVGRAVHQALEHADFAAPASIAEVLRRAAPGQARELGLEPDEVLRAATDALAGFLRSDLVARLARAEILGRETPILFRDADGRTVHGYADLIYRWEGRVHVADYKTDAGVAETLAEHYRPQLADYAAAVSGALGLAEPPVVELILVRSGERVPL